jgi:hypothetical protein
LKQPLSLLYQIFVGSGHEKQLPWNPRHFLLGKLIPQLQEHKYERMNKKEIIKKNLFIESVKLTVAAKDFDGAILLFHLDCVCLEEKKERRGGKKGRRK